MDYAVIISAIVLGLSALATAAKFLDWFLHSDPKTMVRTLRWMLLLLVIAGIPLLVMMIMRQQWAGAMLLGAAMIAIPTFLRWNVLSGSLRAAFGRLRPRPAPFEMPPIREEDERREAPSVREAAAILAAYVGQRRNSLAAVAHLEVEAEDGAADEDDTSTKLREALNVLGLDDGADLAAVRAAHRKLMRAVDPDAGGSPYLAARVDEARDVLVVALTRRQGPSALRDATLRRLANR
ncbi:hypothetical protein BH10PSE6_BH10PSE6_06730 [soil metagenome]